MHNGLSYDDALGILRQYGKGSCWIDHCLAVSRLAGRYAEIFSAGRRIDIGFVRTAGLLHDIGRYKTHDPILHGLEGYRLLMDLGHRREAFVCASHILCGLKRDEAVSYGFPEQDFVPRTFEERLIPVVDSLVEFDRPTTLEERVASIKKRYQGKEHFLLKIERTVEIVRDFIDKADAEFGVSMEKIAEETLAP